MLRNLIVVIVLSLFSFLAFSQSSSKWQIATITEVAPHPAAEKSASETTSYDVTVRVGDTIYLVLYTPPLGEIPPKYVAGRELLVLVGKDTLTYNNMLGRSFEVPIQTRKAASEIRDAR